MDPNALCTALHAVRMLRLDVGELFGTLSDCLRDDHGEEGKESKFLQELQDMIATVHRRFRELEQSVNSLSPPAGVMLYNSSFLTQESAPDKQALYSPLVLSHKWTDKIHKYSSLAFSILSQNSLKKSYYYSMMNKRKRPPINNHNVLPQQMDVFLAGVDRLFPDMNITVSRPFTSNVVMQVTLGRVLQAIIIFKGIMIEWIVVRGYGESCNIQTDLASESKYQVFRRVNDHAHAANLHFSGTLSPEIAARSFIGWLNSYTTLFTATCKHCGKHLHDFYPPTWRDFRTSEPYHFECKP